MFSLKTFCILLLNFSLFNILSPPPKPIDNGPPPSFLLSLITENITVGEVQYWISLLSITLISLVELIDKDSNKKVDCALFNMS